MVGRILAINSTRYHLYTTIFGADSIHERLSNYYSLVGLRKLEAEMPNLNNSPQGCRDLSRSPAFGAQRRFKYEASTTPGGENVVKKRVVELDLRLTNGQTNNQATNQPTKQAHTHTHTTTMTATATSNNSSSNNSNNNNNNNNNNSNRANGSLCYPWNEPAGPGEYEKSAWDDASTAAPCMHSMLETLRFGEESCSVKELVPPKKTSMTMEIHHFFYRGIHLTSNCCFSIVMLFFGGVLTYVDIITYLVGIKASRWCFVVPGSRCIRISLSWWNIVAHPKEVAVDEHTKQKLVLSCHFNRKSYHQSLCRHAYGIPKANAPCVLKICSFCYGKRTVERHARFIIYHSFIILLFVAYLDIRIVSVHVFVGTRSKGSISQDGFHLDFNCAVSSVA